MNNVGKSSVFSFDDELINAITDLDVENDDELKSFYKLLQSKLDSFSSKRNNEKKDYQQDIDFIWGDWIKHLKNSGAVLLAIINLSENLNYGLEVNAIKLEVIYRLVGRGIQIFDEIIVLLENGYPNGAMARWRSLYELQIVLQYLAKYNDDYIYEMYYDHGIYREYTLEKDRRLETNIDKGYRKKYTDAVFIQLEEKAKEIEAEYDVKLFSNDFGWTYKKLNKCSFKNIERDVDEKQLLRIYYKDSCDRIHSSSRGTFCNIGVFDSPNLIQIGASFYGISLPAQLANISLNNILHAFCRIFPFKLAPKILLILDSITTTINLSIDRTQTQIESEMRNNETKI